MYFRDCSAHFVLVEIVLELEESKIRLYDSVRRPISDIRDLEYILNRLVKHETFSF